LIDYFLANAPVKDIKVFIENLFWILIYSLITGLIKQGTLLLTMPDKPTSPKQKYYSNK